jgi:hypothetical protein
MRLCMRVHRCQLTANDRDVNLSVIIPLKVSSSSYTWVIILNRIIILIYKSILIALPFISPKVQWGVYR